MAEALSWWLVMALLGAVAFPITFAFLPGLADRGYAFSKVLGLLIISYALWIAGTAHVLPNQRWSIILLLLIFAAVSAFVAWRRRDELRAFLREHAPYILCVEALFAVAFGVSLWLRSHVAEINSVEQPMDFAMLNTIVRGEYFPPLDPWLAGETVNYHYFGFLETALLTKLTGVSPSVAFNLGLALFIGLAFTAGFGLVYNVAAGHGAAMVKWGRLNAGAVGLGVLAVILLFIFSNFEGVFEMLAAHGLGPQGLYDVVDIGSLEGPHASESHAWYPTEHNWWMRAVGFWGTWTEFPFFTFQLGNLHPNLMGVAGSLLGFALGWNLLAGDGAPLRAPWRHPLHLALTGLVIGSLLFTNGWSFPLGLAFVLAFALLKLYQMEGKLGRRELLRFLLYGTAVAAVSYLAYMPFTLTTDFPVHLKRATGPIVEPMDLFMMWGFFLIVIFVWAVFAITRHPQGWRFSRRQLTAAAVLGTLPVALWPVSKLFLETRNLPDIPYLDATGWWTVFILTSLLTLVILAIVRQLPLERERSEQLPLVFSLVAAAIGLLFILGPELYILLDPIQLRVNTVSKSWFQAWLLLAIATSFALYWIIRTWRPGRLSRHIGLPAWSGLVVVLLLAGLVYPVAVAYSRTFNFAGVRPHDGVPRTIDGTAFLKRHGPAELEALQWIDENVEGQPVILEATCCSRIGFSDVSGYSGLVTVLGWSTHEYQWRGDWALADPNGERLKDVERAYIGTVEEAKAVIEKYNVEYVYVGRTEREYYRDLEDSPLRQFPWRIDKFQRFMDVVFQNELVTIYRVREPRGSAASGEP